MKAVLTIRWVLTYLVQLLLWIPVRLLFIFLYKHKVETSVDLTKLTGPYIIAANHGSYIDAFLLSAAFLPKPRFFPLWYMTTPRFYFDPFLRPILWLLGSFPVFKRVGMAQTLSFPLEILHNGGVVVIFPEGRRRKPIGRPPKARRGVSYLAANANVPIIPVWLDDILGLDMHDTMQRTRHIKIRIGEPFVMPEEEVYDDATFSRMSDEIMNRVWALDI